MGFSRQEYWSGLPFPSPGDLPDPGTEPGSPALEADALTFEPPRKPIYIHHIFFIHSSVYGHLGFFHVLAIVYSVVMNIGVYVSFSIMVFTGYMPRSGIAES